MSTLSVHKGFAIGLSLLVSGVVLADGFRNPPEGAAALGRAGVRLTQGDDASAVTHNPANILDLDSAAIMAGVTMGHAEKEYRAPVGLDESTGDLWSYMPFGYAVVPMAEGRCAMGVGVHSPFGQATEWDQKGIFTGLSPYYSRVRSVNVNPSYAIRLGDRVTFGVGVDVLWSEIELRQTNPWGAGPNPAAGPTSRFTFKADGYGVGANAGVTCRIGERQRLALTYRSPITVEAEGDFKISDFPNMLPPQVTAKSDLDTDLDFPAVAALGYGTRLGQTWRVEANVEWVQHSVYDTMEIDAKNNNLLLNQFAGAAPLKVKQNWDDTWTFSVGADWALSEAWTLRCGYSWLPTPIPDDRLSSASAEGDQHVIGLGAGYRTGRHQVDVAVAPAITRDGDDAAGGTYEFSQQLAAVSYQFSF